MGRFLLLPRMEERRGGRGMLMLILEITYLVIRDETSFLDKKD